jgi:hypothetical protein
VSKRILSLIVCLFLSSINAQTNICSTNEEEVVIAFLNGIQNTEDEAKKSLERLKEFYGETAPNGEKIRYELLYNDTEGMFDDLVEVFGQRMGELKDESGKLLRDRYELFFEAMNGDGAWYKVILNTVEAFGDVAVAFADDTRLRAQNSLLSLLNSSPTEVNYIEHKTRIDNWVVEGKKLLFIAHSQGNLFGNAVYDYTKSKVGTGPVKIIHVAPASYVTNGVHILSDQDFVIGGLRTVVGNLPEVTVATDNYFNRPAGANGKTDITGHGFVEIYINPELPISMVVDMAISDALKSFETPHFTAQTGFFTATLIWDGTGDVDLHVYEPDGFWVYFANRRGNSGRLDVDNQKSYGPEHYYASCTTNRLQEGTYVIKISNYRNAYGRTATVQIASYQDGVLGTKSVTLGGETGSDPAYSMFNVLVSKNSDTNQYSVSLR